MSRVFRPDSSANYELDTHSWDDEGFDAMFDATVMKLNAHTGIEGEVFFCKDSRSDNHHVTWHKWSAGEGSFLKSLSPLNSIWKST